MNREILFRAKCASTGEWVYGLPLTETTLSNSISHIAQFFGEKRKFGRTNVKIDPSTVGQLHNALTRKAGTNVFVGDIIRHDLEEGLGQPKRIGEISTVNSIEFDYAYYINVRVVGTIHDTHLTQQS